MPSHSISNSAALLCAMLPCVTGVARADVVLFKDGRRMEGIIVERGGGSLIIRQGRARIRIAENNVASIEEGSPADELLIQARESLAEGEPEEGLRLLGDALKSGASGDEIARQLVIHQTPLLEALGAMNGAQRGSFAEMLDGLAGVQPPQAPEWLAAQLRWRIELGQSMEVSRLLAAFKSAEPKAFASREDEITGWLGARADRALEAEDFSLALDLLLELGMLDRGDAGNRRVEMALLWARRERDRHDYAAAIRVYQDQLLPLSPKIAQDRIAVTLEDAERHYRETGELGRAIDLYEEFGLVHQAEFAGARLVELWHEFGRGFLAGGLIEEARRAFGRSEKLVPGSAARELALCDHAEMKAGLARGDHVGHFRLGEWCVGKGLLNEARASFQVAADSEVLREAAWEQVQLLNDRQAEEDLKRLLDLYEAGKYVEVIDGVLGFKSRPAAEGLHAQAAQLERLAREAISASVAERPQQAEVLMQQAERAYWTGSTQEADGLLRTLMERYADTPAGARAAQFHRMVKPRLDLDTLERRRRAPSSAAAGDDSADDSAISEEIRRFRESIRERGVEQSDGKGDNANAPEKGPAVDLGSIPETLP